MFIFNLTYIKPILEVEKMLPAHISYLEENYNAKNLYVLEEMSDGALRETQTANYFFNLYPIDCAVPSVNAVSCRKCGALLSAWIPL
jgi:hypothetical protein